MSDGLDDEYESIPDALRERDQWVCWRETERDGKPTKIPVTPGTGAVASATDPETWASFGTAFAYSDTANADGIGFVFTDDDPIVGVDLDDCRAPESGDVDDAALDIIERLDSYTEVSPSGTGFHVLINGDLPDGRNRRGSVELYDTARFFTVTGNHVERTPLRVARRQDALVAIHQEYVQRPDDDGGTETQHQHTETPQSDPANVGNSDVDFDDEELLEKARNASNGEKFERLWNGTTSGYDSQSEADMALCCLLAFWTGGDRAQMDRLFRQSGLVREKWDEVHYADGSTYGEKTIERAIATTSEYYDPDASDDTTHADSDSSAATIDSDDEDPERSRAYLIEKNRLLTERVDELETLLAQKDERIETLETALAELADDHAVRNQTAEQSQDAQTDTTSDSNGETAPASLWERILSRRSE